MPSNWSRYPKKVGTVKERLLARVHQEDRGYETPCLIFDGEKDKDGYGRIKYRGKYVQAHWVLDGRPPKGMDKDHLCHQRDCVRPSHLENVSRSENTKRREKVAKGKRLTPGERLRAKELLDSGWTVAKVAKAFDVSRRTIGRLRDE